MLKSFREHESHEFHECNVRKFLLIAIEFHEYAVRNVFASHFVKENSLKGMKYIAQWQATLGAAPWGRE